MVNRETIYKEIKKFKEKVQNHNYKDFTDIDFLLLNTCLVFDDWNDYIQLIDFDISEGKHFCTIINIETEEEEEIEILNLQDFLEDYRICLPSTKGAIEYVEIKLGQREDFSLEIAERLVYYGAL